jgi:hypothetical protein
MVVLDHEIYELISLVCFYYIYEIGFYVAGVFSVRLSLELLIHAALLLISFLLHRDAVIYD